MKWVNPQGEVEVINAERDPEKMHYARSSNGLFGVIFEVTFRIQKPVLLHYEYAAFPLDRLPEPRRDFRRGRWRAWLYDPLLQPHRGRAPLDYRARRICPIFTRSLSRG